MFGSCRVGAPEELPYTLSASEDPKGVGIDALWAFSKRLQKAREPWPDCLLLLGDQVYADEISPETLAFARSRRDVSLPPGKQVADFEEYTRLYRESWDDPDIRWLLATVPSTMIFDDHDVHDDWNISWAWIDEMRRLPWWEDHIVGAFMSYWLYQHLGNLAPPELAEEPLYAQLRADEDGGPRLRAFAHMADRESAASRWAFHRDFGKTRLVVVDSRAARVLADGRRDMVDAEEWDWIVEHAHGDYDHLIIASTLPVFMTGGIHELEAWNEAVCAGAWGRIAIRPAEKLRRALDLEHWAAFQRSFATMVELLADLARRPGAPSTITLIGGDVHTASIAEVDGRGRAGEPHLAGRLLAVPQPAGDEGAAGRPRACTAARSRASPRRSPASRASSAPPRAGSSSRGRRSRTRSPSSISTSATRRGHDPEQRHGGRRGPGPRCSRCCHERELSRSGTHTSIARGSMSIRRP